jgi:cellulose synthase/poly-beta-1,6-N-acetylglucosamine synthase-like glycosyltransferase
MSLNVLQTLVEIFFGVPIIIFSFYGSVLVYYGFVGEKKENRKLSYAQASYEPSVSIVLPTHNEENVIAKRIENLLASNYPKEKMRIIIVDDSIDSTPKIIEQYMRKYSRISLIRFDERMGYSPCLIAGCKAADSEVVILSEASSLMEQDAIRYLVGNFVDPSVGVVTGKSVVLNADKEAGQSEGFYMKILDFVRRAESNMDSTIYMKGEAAAVRKEILNDLEELEKVPGTADTGIALLARKKGFRSIYDSKVRFFEYAPYTHKERTKQKVTRGANLIKVLWTFHDMLLNPKYGRFGMITMPISLAMLAIVPLLLLVGALILMVLTILNPLAYLPLWAVCGAILVIGYVFWKPAVLTMLESEFSLLKALYEIVIIRKSHDKIERVISTRRLSS